MAVQMQKQRQDQVQETPTEVQSINLVRNLLNTTVGAITYLRVIFAENHYRDTNINGMSLKSLERGHSKEADDLMDWLECGVFDALEKKFLKTLIFGIYANPDEPEKLLESYTFNFSYPSDGQFHVSFVADGKPAVHFKTKKEIMKATSEMLRRLLTLTQSLSPLPDTPNITMKIYYYDEVTPEDYEPPFFVASDHTKPYYFTHRPEKLVIGDVETAYHALNLRLQHAHEDPDGDEPMEKLPIGRFALEEDENAVSGLDMTGKTIAIKHKPQEPAPKNLDIKAKPIVKGDEEDMHMPPPPIRKQPLMPTLDTNLSSDARLPLPQFTPISTVGSVGTQDLIMELRAGTARAQEQGDGVNHRQVPSTSLPVHDNIVNHDMEDIDSYSDHHDSHNRILKRPEPSSSPIQPANPRDSNEANHDDIIGYDQDPSRRSLAVVKERPNAGMAKEKAAPPTNQQQEKSKPATDIPHLRAYAKEIERSHVSCACGDAQPDGVMIECTKCCKWSHAVCFGFINQDDALSSTDAITCYQCQHGGSSATFKKCSQITRFRRALMLVWNSNGCEGATSLASRLGLDEPTAAFIFEKLKADGIIRPKPRTGRGRIPKKWPYELVSSPETLLQRDHYMGAEAWRDSSIIMEDTPTTSRRQTSGGREQAKGDVIVPETPTLRQPQSNEGSDAMEVDDDQVVSKNQKRHLSNDDGDLDDEDIVRSSTKLDKNTAKRRKVSVAARR